MDLHLEEVCLEVGTHNSAGDTDAEGGEGVEARDVAWGLGNRFLGTVGSGERGGGACCELATDALRLNAHSDQTSEPEHHSDANVLHLLRGVGVTGVRAEALHPCVGDTVEEDDQRFNELGGRDTSMVTGSPVPGPAKL